MRSTYYLSLKLSKSLEVLIITISNFSLILEFELEMNFDQIESLLTILIFLGNSDSEIYRNIVLRAMEKKDQLEDMMDYLIHDGNLKILTKEELESLNIRKMT